MSTIKRYSSLQSIAFYLFFLSVLFFWREATAQIANHVVISEVYINAAGSTELDEFVELYNPTNSPVTFTSSDTLITQNATGLNKFTFVLTGSIPAHGFYLIGDSTTSPTPDMRNASFSLTNSGGSVFLKSGATTVDAVGWGTSPLIKEGTALAGSPTELTSYERKAQSTSTAGSMGSGGSDEFNGNGWDAGDNGTDFITRSAGTSQPQNTSSSTETPPTLGNNPPIISNVSRSPFIGEVTDTVTANVNDIDGTVVTVRLHIKINGGADDSSTTMVFVSGTQYQGVIPVGENATAGDLVEYFISAIDDSSKYSSTSATPQGFFVGDAPISSIKSYSLSAISALQGSKSSSVASIVGYGARINGTINVRTNLFTNGQGFIQDATGGLQMFQAGGLPVFEEGRNVKVQGTIQEFDGAYELSTPNLSFVDTTLGTSSITPVTITLPTTQSPAYANEGKVVKIEALSTDSTGTFTAFRSYSYRDGESDTITVRVESNGVLNTLVGTTIPSTPVDAVGILSYRSGFQRLKPRKAADMGVSAPTTFEAVSPGNWSDTLTWSSHQVPGPSDNVTMSTLNVTVTIDISNAQCNNLTMTGSGTASNSGPVLQFMSTGTPQLTINGNLTISGGTGGGSGDRGGRPQLTSNGNSSATLVIKKNIRTTSSNSTSNGNAGLNMNEGTVKLIGSTTDSLKNGAGLRLGNLQIGGESAGNKILVWAPTTGATLSIRSLTIKSSSTFLIGDAAGLNANDIGNAFASGVPTLTGGITVESGASLINQDFSGGVNVASINLDGGGITNNGTIDLRVGAARNNQRSAANSAIGCIYNVYIGGVPVGASSTKQTISGTQVGQFANIIVDSGDTLNLLQDVNLPSYYKMTLNGTLVETPGNTVIGPVEAMRVVAQSVDENFGGIGLTINAASAAPDTTIVTRVTGIASSGGGNSSILRYFDASPRFNSGLNATLDFYYDDSELAGQDASTLQLWKSTDGGTTWSFQSSTVDVGLHRLHATGVNSLSRWTASDAAHPLGAASVDYNFNASWNMISVPLTVADQRKTTLFPNAISNAFRYVQAYQIDDTLDYGVGYWLKFPASKVVSLTGVERTLDSIPVVEGWNMIGTISNPVDKDNVVQVPSGIVVSSYFGYQGGYTVAETLEAARAYWVKANAAGTLVLSSSVIVPNKASSSMNLLDRFNSLTITDAEGHRQTLYFGVDPDGKFPTMSYELPPLPPKGIFDVRFATNRYVEAYATQRGEIKEYPITIQSVSYPITIRWQVVSNGEKVFVLTRSLNSKPESIQALGSEGQLTLTEHEAQGLALKITDREALPKEFSLSENYPNPFNPSTKLTVAVPKRAFVDVIVYNILGQKISTLLHEEKETGYHTIEWNGQSNDHIAVPSGVYLVRMTSGKFSAVRKVMMVK
ncbi:MAG: lamin tail domain-containing protein [Ignavibacteriae bacterium]|nr:lamin tail domain-containing protein [Ignavibacteriota bacterium]